MASPRSHRVGWLGGLRPLDSADAFAAHRTGEGERTQGVVAIEASEVIVTQPAGHGVIARSGIDEIVAVEGANGIIEAGAEERVGAIGASDGKSTGEHNPHRDCSPEKGLYWLRPIALNAPRPRRREMRGTSISSRCYSVAWAVGEVKRPLVQIV
jgi:hypothetical protein